MAISAVGSPILLADKASAATWAPTFSVSVPAGALLVGFMGSDMIATTQPTLQSSIGNLNPTLSFNGYYNASFNVIASMFLWFNNTGSVVTITGFTWSHTSAVAASAVLQVFQEENYVPSSMNWGDQTNLAGGGSSSYNCGNVGTSNGNAPWLGLFSFAVEADLNKNTSTPNSGWNTVGKAGTVGAGTASNETTWGFYYADPGSGVSSWNLTVNLSVSPYAAWQGVGVYFISPPVVITPTVLTKSPAILPRTVTGKALALSAAVTKAAEILPNHFVFPIPATVLTGVPEIPGHYNVRTNPIWQDKTDTGAIGGATINKYTLDGDATMGTLTLAVSNLTQKYSLDTPVTLNRRFTQRWKLDPGASRSLGQSYLLDTLAVSLITRKFNQMWACDTPGGLRSRKLRQEWSLYSPTGQFSWNLDQKWSLLNVEGRTWDLTQSYTIDGPTGYTYELDQKWKLEPSYTVQQQSIAPYGIRVGQGHIAPYSSRVSQQFIMPLSTRVSQQHATPLPYRVAQGHVSGVSYTGASIKSQEIMKYSMLSTNPVAASNVALYGYRVAQQHKSKTVYNQVVRQQHVDPYGQTSQVAQQHIDKYDLPPLTRVAQESVMPYTGLIDSSDVSATEEALLSFVFGGVTYTSDPDSFTLSQDEGDYAWKLEVSLSEPDAYRMLSQDMAVVFSIGTEQWSLIVDSKSIDRSDPLDKSWKVSFVSPAAKLDNPRYTMYSATFENQLASEIASQLGALRDINVTWNLIDWVVPAGVLALTDSSPLKAIQDMAEAVGGLVESLPDGTLNVQSKYPVGVALYPVSADHTLTDVDDNLSASESLQPRSFYNSFEVGDTQPAENNAQMEFVPDEWSTTTGVIKVYLYPWRTGVRLATTNSTATVGTGAVKEEVNTGTVAFSKNTGTTRYPIYSLTSVVWETTDLGALDFEEGTAELKAVSSGDGYSLAEVDYVSRFVEYRVSGALGTSAQFVLIEDE